MKVWSSAEAMESVTLAAGVSLVTNLQAVDWPGSRLQLDHYFFFPSISLLQIGSKTLCSVLSWAFVSSQIIGVNHWPI